jgi:hypothetical protein
MLPRSPGNRPGALLALGALARASFICIGLLLVSVTVKIVHDDFHMVDSLLSMDRDRCAAIAFNYPPAQRSQAVEHCLARASAKEKGYWRFATAHALVVFLALVALPGIVTFVIAAMLRRSRTLV